MHILVTFSMLFTLIIFLICCFHLDYTEALQWYLKAAEKGHARAQHNIGSIYHHGHGSVPQDFTEVRIEFMMLTQTHTRTRARAHAQAHTRHTHAHTATFQVCLFNTMLFPK